MATNPKISKTLSLPDMTDRYPSVGNPPDGYVITYRASDGYYLALPPNKLLVLNSVSSTPYSVATEDVVMVSHAGAFVVNLPTSPLVGTNVFIKDASGNAASFNITVAATQLIDGAASYTINTNYGVVRVAFTGTTWIILSKF